MAARHFHGCGNNDLVMMIRDMATFLSDVRYIRNDHSNELIELFAPFGAS